MKIPESWLLAPLTAKLNTTLSLINGILALTFLWLLASMTNTTITTILNWIR